MRFNGKLLKGDGTIPMVGEGWLVAKNRAKNKKKARFFSSSINSQCLGTLKNHNSNQPLLSR